jgi:hypothetical protein
MCGPPAWELDVGLTTPHRKNKLVMKDHRRPRTWTDSLDKRPKRKKMDMGFGTWNVRNMCKAISLRAVAEVGVQEVRWDRGNTKHKANIHISGRGMRIMN